MRCGILGSVAVCWGLTLGSVAVGAAPPGEGGAGAVPATQPGAQNRFQLQGRIATTITLTKPDWQVQLLEMVKGATVPKPRSAMHPWPRGKAEHIIVKWDASSVVVLVAGKEVIKAEHRWTFRTIEFGIVRHDGFNVEVALTDVVLNGQKLRDRLATDQPMVQTPYRTNAQQISARADSPAQGILEFDVRFDWAEKMERPPHGSQVRFFVDLNVD